MIKFDYAKLIQTRIETSDYFKQCNNKIPQDCKSYAQLGERAVFMTIDANGKFQPSTCEETLKGACYEAASYNVAYSDAKLTSMIQFLVSCDGKDGKQDYFVTDADLKAVDIIKNGKLDDEEVSLALKIYTESMGLMFVPDSEKQKSLANDVRASLKLYSSELYKAAFPGDF